MLNYESIFSAFGSLISTALPIAIFLFLVDVALNFFFSLAFPKWKKGE